MVANPVAAVPPHATALLEDAPGSSSLSTASTDAAVDSGLQPAAGAATLLNLLSGGSAGDIEEMSEGADCGGESWSMARRDVVGGKQLRLYG